MVNLSMERKGGGLKLGGREVGILRIEIATVVNVHT